MTSLVTEKATEGRREGPSQAHRWRTYSIAVVKAPRKEHEYLNSWSRNIHSPKKGRDEFCHSACLLFIQSGSPACGLLQPIPRVDLPSLVKTSLKICTQTCLECFLGDFQSSQVDNEVNHLFHFLLLSSAYSIRLSQEPDRSFSS